VDGGITVATAPLAVGAGASVLVAGTAVFGQKDYAKAIQDLRLAAEQAR
jgi:ribulose-phosphate 3-epimerase